MKILGIIFGVLLLLFGGGCTAIYIAAGGGAAFSGIWMVGGLLPMALGAFICYACIVKK